MNAQLTVATQSASSGALLMSLESMDRLERIADLMASGKATVPKHLRGSKGDCFAVALQSMQWGMNPFAVAQKTFFINDTIGYEAQLVSAVINSSGAVKDRFHFEWFGPWERVIGKFQIKRNQDGKEYRVPSWTLADEEGCGVRVWATIKGEQHPRTLELLLAQARTRNSTLWADDPKQQIAYLAEKRWARLYSPDVILGVYTPDEFESPTEIQMGNVVMADADGQASDQAGYPEAEFNKNLEAWAKVIATGRKQMGDLIAMVESKGKLSQQQKDALQAAVDKLNANTVDASQTAGAPATTAEEIASRMKAAKDLDSFYIAADLIESIQDEAQRIYLTEIFNARQAELGG